MTSKATAYGPATIDYVPEMPKVSGIEVEHLDGICEFLWFQELCRRADRDFSYRATEPGGV